jgi:hypothetical protein
VAGPDVAERVRAGLVAFAAGEALGAPWAGRPPREIRRDAVLAGVGAPGQATAALLAGVGAPGPATAALAAGLGSSLPGAVALGWAQPRAAARRDALAEAGLDGWMVAELAAGALAGRPLHHAVRDHGEEWNPPYRGPRAPREVVAALMALVFRHDDPADAMLVAVRYGGETALLAALAGGVLGTRRVSAVGRIPWLERVALPPGDVLDAAAARLAAGHR